MVILNAWMDLLLPFRVIRCYKGVIRGIIIMKEIVNSFNSKSYSNYYYYYYYYNNNSNNNNSNLYYFIINTTNSFYYYFYYYYGYYY